MKANFGILPPLELASKIGKRDRGKAYAERALGIKSRVERSRSVKSRSIVAQLLLVGLLILPGCYNLSQPAKAAADTLNATEQAAISAVPHQPATKEKTPTASPTPEAATPLFDGQRAYEDVKTQVSFGPRSPGTKGHDQIVAWIQKELEAAGWQVEIQDGEALGHSVKNIVAKRGDAPPQIIIGAHYDSRMYADNDPDPANQKKPVPAANDGGSGVAVLLGLARSLPRKSAPVWLVFFDAEDNGRIEGWDWILGRGNLSRIMPPSGRVQSLSWI